MGFRNEHILSINQFNKDDISQLFNVADKMDLARKDTHYEPLKGLILGNLFFEASTRTRLSFASAFNYLGGKVNSTIGANFSSMAKGETLSDTVNVISLYCDIAVIRHPEMGSAKEAAKASRVPIINAGDGPGEHPTQALLDLYTIYKEKNTLSNLTITITGDLRFGRTVHSLVNLLSLYNNITLYLAAPAIVQMPEKIIQDLKQKGVTIHQTSNFEDAIKEADVLYSTRIQKERFANLEDYERIKNVYILNKEKVTSLCKPSVTIMHPLPRVSEIDPDVDTLSNAAYFRQSENGLLARMALFLLILGKEDTLHHIKETT